MDKLLSSHGQHWTRGAADHSIGVRGDKAIGKPMFRGHGKQDQVGGSIFRCTKHQVALRADLSWQLRNHGRLVFDSAVPQPRFAKYELGHLSKNAPRMVFKYISHGEMRLVFPGERKGVRFRQFESGRGIASKQNTLRSEFLTTTSIR